MPEIQMPKLSDTMTEGTLISWKKKVGDQVTAGEVLFEGKNLLDMDPEERAREGVFLAFQHPVEIPGVSNTYFLRAAVNAVRKHRGPTSAPSR